MRRLLVGVLLAVIAVLLAACSSSAPTAAKGSDLNDNAGTGTFQGAGLQPPQPRPQFTLTDTAGTPFNFGAQTSGHPTMLFFGYTQCPDVCPETMADAMLVLRHVPASVASNTYVVFVSTDVVTDTAAVIKRWMTNFSGHTPGHWVGLRGTQAQVNAAQAAAHVTLAEDGGKTHSAQVLLYGPDDYAHVTFLQSSNEQKQMQHDLPLVAAGQS